MAKKSNFIKNLLTTASAVAVLAGSIESAMAVAAVRQTNGNVTFQDGGGTANFAIVGNWVPGSSIKIGAGGNTLTPSGAATVSLIDLNNLAPGALAADHALSIGAVVDLANPASANRLDTVVNDAITLTLTGVDGGLDPASVNNYDHLGAIVLSAGGGAATLNINLTGLNPGVNPNNTKSITLTGTIDSNAGVSDGIITIQAGNEVTFSGIIGNAKQLGKLELVGGSVATLNANASFSNGGAANTIKMGDGSTLNVTGARTLTFANNDSLDGAAAGKGKVVITPGVGNTATFVDVAIGGNTAIDSVTIKNGKFKTNKAIVAKNGVVLGNDGAGGTGTLNVNGANLLITTTEAGKGIIGDGSATPGSVLMDSAHSLTVSGSVGTVAEPIASIEIANAAAGQTLLIQDVANAANFLTTNDGITWDTLGGGGVAGGKLKSKSADLTINSDVGTAAKKLTEVIISSNSGGGAFGKVTLAAGKKIFATDIKLEAGQNNRLELLAGSEVHGTVGIDQAAGVLKFAGAGSKVVGNIKGTTADRGIVEVAEDASVQGNIGTAGAINELTFTVAGKTLTVDSNGAAGGIRANTAIKFEADSTLVLKGVGQNQAIESVISVGAGGAGAAGGVGTIVVDNTIAAANNVTFSRAIGDHADDAKSLKLLRNEGDAQIIFDGANNYHIKKLELVGDAKVTLSENNGNYRFGGITTDADGDNTLEISAGVVNLTNDAAGTEVNFGTGNHSLESLKFLGDYTLNVADGINIYAHDVTNTGANHGTIEFKGSSVFRAPIADTKALKQIKLGANGKVVKIWDNIKTDATIDFTGDGTFEFFGTTLDAKGGINLANKAGKIIFNNTGAAIVKGGALTNAGTMAGVEFAGGDVTFDTAGGAFTHAADITISGKADKRIEFNAATDIGNNKVMVTSTGATTLAINKDTTFTKAVGAADKFVKIDVKTFAAKVDNLTNPATDLAGVTFISGTTNATSSLELAKTGAVIRAVGDETNPLKSLTFTQDGSVTLDAFANESKVAVGKTATFGGRVKGSTLNLLGLDSTAVFKSGATLEADLVDTLGNKGKATFEGNATLNNVIGASGKRLAEVKFTGAAGTNIVLNKNIHATAIGFAKQNIAINEDVSLDGLTTLDGSNVTLNNNKVITSSGAGGGLLLKGDVKVTTSISEDKGDDLLGGSIKLASGTTLSYNGLNSLIIYITGSTTASPKERSFAIIDNTDGTAVADANALDLAKLTVDFATNSLSKWEKALDANGGVAIVQKNNVVAGIADSFKRAGIVASAADIQNLELISKGTGDAKLLVDALNRMDDAKRAEATQRLIANEVNQELENVVSDAATSVAGRMFVNNPGNLGSQPIESAYNDAAPYSGVAAGEEAGRYGVWANPFFGNGTQKARKGTAGFKSERYGASIGFDVKANDNMMVGVAMTYLNTSIKHKNQKVGDTTKADSVLFSIYGMQQFTDNWFGQGIATFGSNKVKNNEGRVKDNNMTQRAIGNYTSMSFGGEVMAGYNYFMADQFTLTPMVGLRYTRVNDGGYRESGTDFSNLDVNKKASNKFEVVVGARAAASSFELNGMYVTPEVHGFINHDIVGKNPDVQMRLNGVNSSLVSNKSKPVKTSYTLGAGLNASYGMMDYGVGYDANIADKYIGHQGSIKVRVNF